MTNLLDFYKSAYKDSAGLSSSYIVDIQKKVINESEYLIVDGMLVVEIPEVNFLISSNNRENEIDLIFEGGVVGQLNLINKNKKMSDIDQLNKSKIIYCIYYIIYNTPQEMDINFQKNFLLIDEGFSEKYFNNYLQTSSFWGGFSHTAKSFVFEPIVNEIELPVSFEFPTIHNSDIAFSSIFSSNPLEKFLALLHKGLKG